MQIGCSEPGRRREDGVILCCKSISLPLHAAAGLTVFTRPLVFSVLIHLKVCIYICSLKGGWPLKSVVSWFQWPPEEG